MKLVDFIGHKSEYYLIKSWLIKNGLLLFASMFLCFGAIIPLFFLSIGGTNRFKTAPVFWILSVIWYLIYCGLNYMFTELLIKRSVILVVEILYIVSVFTLIIVCFSII